MLLQPHNCRILAKDKIIQIQIRIQIQIQIQIPIPIPIPIPIQIIEGGSNNRRGFK
jgi:hypothetical protein